MLKKGLLACAVLAASSMAYAESQVTLYGAVDAAVSVSKAKGDSTLVQLEDGIAGGSVWGITGTEDLGNGYEVGFTLENGFTVDNGAAGESGLAFNKQSTLSISGGFGELAFGRMGTLASYEGSYSILDASPFGTDYLQAGLGNVFVTGNIFNNTVVYVTPEFAGFKVYAQYSNGTEAEANKWSYNQHYYGLGATYEIGNFNLAAVVERFDQKGQDKVNEFQGKSATVYSLSAAYDFEVVKVYGGYQYANRYHSVDQLEDAAFGGKGFNQHAFSLGAEVPAGGGTFKAAVNYGWGKIASLDAVDGAELDNRKFNRIGGGVAYEYPLSKRTFVYSWGAVQKGGKAFKDSGDFQNWSLGVGLHHEF